MLELITNTMEQKALLIEAINLLNAQGIEAVKAFLVEQLKKENEPKQEIASELINIREIGDKILHALTIDNPKEGRFGEVMRVIDIIHSSMKEQLAKKDKEIWELKRVLDLQAIQMKDLDKTCQQIKKKNAELIKSQQPKPSKSIEECLNEVAKTKHKHLNGEEKYKDWYQFMAEDNGTIIEAIKEAMQLYYEQGKPRELMFPALMEIEAKATELGWEWSTVKKEDDLIKFSEWMRQQIKDLNK